MSAASCRAPLPGRGEYPARPAVPGLGELGHSEELSRTVVLVVEDLGYLDHPEPVRRTFDDPGRICIRAALLLGAATCTMPLGLDRTALWADEMRPARRIPAARWFCSCRFHPSSSLRQLLLGACLTSTTKKSNPTYRVVNTARHPVY